MRWLVTGVSGQLGSYLLRQLRQHGEPIVAWSGARGGELFGTPLQPVDLGNPDVTAGAFRAARPDSILHAAAVARVDECYRDPERARRVNIRGSALLAEMAEQAGARLLAVSTDLVFDGQRGGYREDDAANPLSVYGRTKAEGESAVLATRRAVVARVSLLFGPTLVGRSAFFDGMVDGLRTGRPVTLFADEWRTPLGLGTAARALVGLARADVTGLMHIGGPERLSRLEMGRQLAEYLRVSPDSIVAAEREAAPAPEPRPRDTSLDSSRWRGLFSDLPWPTYRESLVEMLPVI